MAGGIIQISSYGAQDIILTGTPEITFFKVAYRRHTNFVTESIKLPFDTPVGFGNTATLIVPKIGDLMHKSYLEIILPEINLKRFMTSRNNKNKKNKLSEEYKIVLDFLKINREAYIEALDIFDAENCTKAKDVIEAINFIFNNSENRVIVKKFKKLMKDYDTPYRLNEVNLESLGSCFNPTDSKDDIMEEFKVAIEKSDKLHCFFFKRHMQYNCKKERDNVNFAWVDRIGHAIIKELTVYIGGQKIDTHTGDWINIWYELTAKRDLEDIYFKMIGNIKILTEFNRKPKPKYILQIPLQFWFCRFSGLALPLVALEDMDVKFEVTFRNLEEVAYIGKGETIKHPDCDEGLRLDEITDDIDIEASMLIDYVYLDGDERKRFAQSGHEYLIEQVQVSELFDLQQENVSFIIDSFVHPVKELIWVSQKVRYTENIDGFTKTRLDNYSLTDKNEENPIKDAFINFNSYNRIMRLDGNYFNYVQPYQHHYTTPSDGINVYSFAIYPEEHQPSDTANFSRISRVTLGLRFKEFNEPFNIKVYGRNLNILRFSHGMAGLAFVY